MAYTKTTSLEARAELFRVFCGKTPKKSLLKPLEQLTDSQFSELQNWVGGNQRVCVWTTNIGLMEAINSLVEEAIGNTNIVA
jgi:hypothetical protein